MDSKEIAAKGENVRWPLFPSFPHQPTTTSCPSNTFDGHLSGTGYVADTRRTSQQTRAITNCCHHQHGDSGRAALLGAQYGEGEVNAISRRAVDEHCSSCSRTAPVYDAY